MRTTLAARVNAWREQGDRAAADALVGELRDDLMELCRDLGVLYADDQAIRAIEAALQVANPQAAPGRWRRRNPGVQAGEWTQAPGATFQGLCIHALLDGAGVGTLTGDAGRLHVAERAALRLQMADVHDSSDVSAWVGLPVQKVEALWLGEFDDSSLVEPSPRWRDRVAKRAAATAGVSTAGVGIFGGSAWAATLSAGAIAGTAAVLGITATTVAVQRQAPSVEVADVPDPSTPDPTLPGVQSELGTVREGVESPLAPGEVRPGLNVPTVDVPEVRLEDLVPPPEGLVPGDLPTGQLPIGDLPLDEPVDLPLDETDRPDLQISELPVELPTQPGNGNLLEGDPVPLPTQPGNGNLLEGDPVPLPTQPGNGNLLEGDPRGE